MWKFLKREKNEEFTPPNTWVDLHTHILFGLDDGPKVIEESIEMISEAEKIGITHIIATPHYSNLFCPSEEDIDSSFIKLTEALRERGSNVKIILWREVNFSMIQIEELKKNEKLLLKGEKNYALIELPEGLNKASIIEGLFELMIAGIHPIIAHPERNSLVEREPDLIRELRDREFLIQLDAPSITGAHGKITKRTAWTLLRKELVDIVSSDAHSAKHFNYLEDACQQLASSFGNEYVQKVISETPSQILQIN